MWIVNKNASKTHDAGQNDFDSAIYKLSFQYRFEFCRVEHWRYKTLTAYHWYCLPCRPNFVKRTTIFGIFLVLTALLTSPQRCSIKLKSGLDDGHSKPLKEFLSKHCCVNFAVWFGSLYWWNFHIKANLPQHTATGNFLDVDVFLFI